MSQTKKDNLKVPMHETVKDTDKEVLRKFMATLPKGK